MAKKEILNTDNLTLRVGEDTVVEKVIEKTADALEVAENSLDYAENAVEKVVTITKNNPLIIAGALLVGVGIGGFVAYKITKKKLEAEFEVELEEQVERAKVFHKRLAKTDEFETVDSAAEALLPAEVVGAISTYQGREKAVPYNQPDKIEDPRPPVEVVVENVQIIEKNVFQDANTADDPRDWNPTLEAADREVNEGRPYVVSFDEFHENEDGHEQVTLAYYAGDDTLADEKDEIVDNIDYTVGQDSLTRFGHGSGDSKIVYVRNPSLSLDFEIIRSNGTYQQEVLGTDSPDSILQHSMRRPNRRPYRSED